MSQFVNNQNKRKNKRLIGELHDFPEGVMAIGRLDENSEGLLLLTTDGKKSEYIRSKKIEKEYYALVDGVINDDAIEALQKGVTIGVNGEEYTTKPCTAFYIHSVAEYPIEDRKVRQVRKMTAAVGFPTLRLVRVRIGNVKLELPAGVVKKVDDFDA